MFSWLKRLLGWEEVDHVAAELADVFRRHVEVSRSGNSRLVDKAFSYVLAQATGEKRKRSWRGNATARLANTFGWALVARGFSEELALGLAKKMAVQLAQKKAKSEVDA